MFKFESQLYTDNLLALHILILHILSLRKTLSLHNTLALYILTLHILALRKTISLHILTLHILSLRKSAVSSLYKGTAILARNSLSSWALMSSVVLED